jgi:transcriptional regulator with XRE-family HTH domain
MKFMMQDSMSARAGKNLKRIIKEKGFTQEQFAEQMYVDPTTVRRWLAHGIKDIDTISTIAEIFDKDVMDILK